MPTTPIPAPDEAVNNCQQRPTTALEMPLGPPQRGGPIYVLRSMRAALKEGGGAAKSLVFQGDFGSRRRSTRVNGQGLERGSIRSGCRLRFRRGSPGRCRRPGADECADLPMSCQLRSEQLARDTAVVSSHQVTAIDGVTSCAVRFLGLGASDSADDRVGRSHTISSAPQSPSPGHKPSSWRSQASHRPRPPTPGPQAGRPDVPATCR